MKTNHTKNMCATPRIHRGHIDINTANQQPGNSSSGGADNSSGKYVAPYIHTNASDTTVAVYYPNSILQGSSIKVDKDQLKDRETYLLGVRFHVLDTNLDLDKLDIAKIASTMVDDPMSVERELTKSIATTSQAANTDIILYLIDNDHPEYSVYVSLHTLFVEINNNTVNIADKFGVELLTSNQLVAYYIDGYMYIGYVCKKAS